MHELGHGLPPTTGVEEGAPYEDPCRLQPTHQINPLLFTLITPQKPSFKQ